MPVKAMSDECYGTYSRLITGIEYATDAGAQIILVASGAYAPTPQLEAAVRYAQESNVLVIGGAGNDATNAPFYPATYGLTVTATDWTGNLYWRSNWPASICRAGRGSERPTGQCVGGLSARQWRRRTWRRGGSGMVDTATTNGE